MSSTKIFIDSVKRIDNVIKRQTADLNHEDSMAQLPFPGNNMNWNLGHILVYRMRCLGFIDGVSNADPDEFAVYGAGSPPLTDSSQAIPLETLLERLDAASAQVIAALEAMPSERLAFYLVFHETYHAGQLEPLRELGLARH